MTKDVNANVVKTLNNKGKAKQTDLRDVIRKYLDNPTNSKSAVNTKEHKEETNIESKGIGSQKERKEQIDSKPKINVTDSLSLKIKSTSTDVRKDLNCQYVSKDKCVNIFNEIGESKMLPGHAPNKDRNLENHSHVESFFNQFGNAEKLRIPGTSLKVANLDVFMEGATEMIGKDIAAKLNEPKVDMVVALVGVIGTEDALRIFKETQKVEAGGGLMIKNGTRRRTAGGTFLQLIREIESPNIDMEEVNSVFERFNEVEKMDSDRVEKKGNVKLDRPCDYFNDTGMCKFKSGHFSQSGFTRRIHSCRFCFYRHEVENGHPEIHCGLYRSYLNNIDSTFQSKEELKNKLQSGDVARQFKATSIEKILTGSNVVPIGIRHRPTEDRKKHREIVEQENTGSNSARSAIMSAKAEGGTTSQTEQRPPSTTRDMSKSKIEMSGNGCERSKKMVQIQNGFGREKDMKKAKEKLTMLSDLISKSVFTEHQDYQAKKELELVEVHSSVGKSRLSMQTDELAINCKIELAMDCKIESQNGKDRKKKGKSCGKCIDEIQGKDKRGEIFEKNVEKKKFSEDVNRGKKKNIEAEKREASESAQEKHYNKAKRKENNEKKKEIVKNESMEDTAEEKEKTDKEIKGNPNLEANKLCTFPMKTPRKENYHCNINEEGSGRKELLFNKKDKEQTQIAALNECQKKQDKFEENKKGDRNVDKQMQKPEINLSNSKTSSVDVFRQTKPVTQIPQIKLANSSGGNGNKMSNSSGGNENKMSNSSGGNENKMSNSRGNENKMANSFRGNENRMANSSRGNENRMANLSRGNENRMANLSRGNRNRLAISSRGNENRMANSSRCNGNRMAISSRGNGNRMANSFKGNGNGKEKLHCPCPPYCPNCLNIIKMEKLG